MRIRIFQIDAFTNRRFKGNPAAVMPMESFLSDAVLQSIASEHNLAETAFLFLITATIVYAGSPPLLRSHFAAMQPWPVPL